MAYRQIRDRNVITLPKKVLDSLKVSVGDWVGFEFLDNGTICIHRVIPHKMRNQNCQPTGEDK